MSLKSLVEKLVQDGETIAFRPAATYTTAAPGPAYTIFTITGGAVWIRALIARQTGVFNAATTLVVAINGIAPGLVSAAGAGAVGNIIWVPLDVAGTIINVAGAPETAALFAARGFITATLTGLIVLTVGGVGGSGVMEWSCVYKRLSPASLIRP